MKYILFTIFAISTLQAEAQTLDTFDINTSTSGVISSLPNDFVIHNSDLYFSAHDYNNGGELRKIENGKSTVKLISDINPGRQISITGTHHAIIAMGNNVYFTAKDTAFNAELWMYDGNNVSLAAEINPGINGSNPAYMALFDEKVYFRAYHDSYGSELWYYDPISKTASLAFDVNPGTSSSTIIAIEPYNGKLYLAADNGTSGVELQEYDPQTKTLTLIKDIHPGPLAAVSRHMLTAGGKLYFLATKDTRDFELYSYDGTNVVQETDLNANSSGVSLLDFHKMMIEWNGSLYFEGYDSTDGFYHLCQYNLSNGNVSFHPIKTTRTDVTSDYAIYNNKLFYAASDGVNGIELWSYDGTNPPKMAYDIDPGLGDSKPEDLTVGADGYLYFSAELHPFGRELFRYKESNVSIENVNTEARDFSLYPNPATETSHLQFNLASSEKLSVAITDMNGRVVYNTSPSLYSAGQHTIDIPVADLPSGIYVCSLLSDQRLLWSGQLKK